MEIEGVIKRRSGWKMSSSSRLTGRVEGGGKGPPGFSEEKKEDEAPSVPQASQYDDDEGHPLELEHMMGYTGRRLGTLLAHPRLSEVFVKSVGSAVVVGDLNDPHQQEFLRGHDMEITAMAISASGNKLASGQVSTFQHAITILHLPDSSLNFWLYVNRISLEQYTTKDMPRL